MDEVVFRADPTALRSLRVTLVSALLDAWRSPLLLAAELVVDRSGSSRSLLSVLFPPPSVLLRRILAVLPDALNFCFFCTE